MSRIRSPRRAVLLVSVALVAIGGQVGALPAFADAGTFSNANPVLHPRPAAPPGCPFPDGCPSVPGSPYPSSIAVAGLSGTITDVDVHLNDFWNEDLPGDSDVMLVAPNGTNLLLMSDVCGDNDANVTPIFLANPVDFELDDAAAGPIPHEGPCASGTFKPTDDDNDANEFVSPVPAGGFPPDSFVAPAPTPSASSTLSAFNGGNPNGTWHLYIVDDFPQAANALPIGGFNGGWSLDITTGSPIQPTPIGVYRPSNSQWFIQSNPAVAFGTTGDIQVPGDYDGNASQDIAVFRPSNGVWYIQGGSTVAWGTSGDIPVPADYDGNGTTDRAVFRPSTGVWYVQGGATVAWGTSGDIPVPGDYDGTGDDEIAVFRPSTSTWFVQGGSTTAWGTSGDIPVPGDYNGNGTTDVAVFRPSNGTWYVQGGSTTAWGTSGDIPVPGDYNANGATDVAVFRPSNGTWYVQAGTTVAFGTTGDRPLPLPHHIQNVFFP